MSVWGIIAIVGLAVLFVFMLLVIGGVAGSISEMNERLRTLEQCLKAQNTDKKRD